MTGLGRLNCLPAFLFAALLCAPVGAGAQLLKPEFNKADKHWIEDKTNHCWAADPDPAEGETVTWSGGACGNSVINGNGVLTWMRGDKVIGRDTGTFKNGMLAGHGKLDFEDGASFEGEFPGDGIITLPDGRRFAAQSIRELAGWSIEQDPRQIEQLP